MLRLCKEPIKNYDDNYHFSGLAGYLRAYIIFSIILLIICTIIVLIMLNDMFEWSYVYESWILTSVLILFPMAVTTFKDDKKSKKKWKQPNGDMRKFTENMKTSANKLMKSI